MDNEASGTKALAGFIQALAVTVVSLDDLPQAQRTAGNFIRCLDGYLGELKRLAAGDGPGVVQDVQILRDNLDKAIGQARLAKMPDGGKIY